MWFGHLPGFTAAEIDELNRRMAAAILTQAIEDGTTREVLLVVQNAVLDAYTTERSIRRRLHQKNRPPPEPD
jgi:hypothetical protein